MIDSLFISPAEWSFLNMCASLNHRKKMKAEPNRLIPLKPTKNLDLLIVFQITIICCKWHVTDFSVWSIKTEFEASPNSVWSMQKPPITLKNRWFVQSMPLQHWHDLLIYSVPLHALLTNENNELSDHLQVLFCLTLGHERTSMAALLASERDGAFFFRCRF